MKHIACLCCPVPAASPTNEVVTVYVGNLPAAVDEYTLACTFMHFGPVVHVQVRVRAYLGGMLVVTFVGLLVS